MDDFVKEAFTNDALLIYFKQKL
ncbi:hypothetical protein AERO8C_150075 [Aeromonas veronii]|uniref:Uncharacterized protein n=1 Tax=Aeromonas veronii TaxID=654 RepID=A0A653KXD4_AERVE|nr:hypothetical protein AERO8C_150075 [Aeromonas veronii]